MSTFRLFSWGANSHGQLSAGYESEMICTPQEVKSFPDVENIVQIAGGGAHVLVRTSENHLYSCGGNSKGQLGNGTRKKLSKFKRVPPRYFGDKLIASIHCGWEESAAISSDGSLFVWGSNIFGQLGMKNTNAVTAPTLLQIPNDEKVKSIQFTYRCAVIITVNNRAYILGHLRYFEELRERKMSAMFWQNNVKFMKIFDDIGQLACGQNHFIYVDKDKSVAGFGSNKFGQTDRVKIFHEIYKMRCGWTHNGVLLRTGDILLWGRNNYGQLGRELKDIIDPIRMPIRLVVYEKFKDFHLGAEHGLAVTTSGKIYTFGFNEHGTCGNGATENVFKPYLVDLPGKYISAACGAGFCYVLTEEEEISKSSSEDNDDITCISPINSFASESETNCK